MVVLPAAAAAAARRGEEKEENLRTNPGGQGAGDTPANEGKFPATSSTSSSRASRYSVLRDNKNESVRTAVRSVCCTVLYYTVLYCTQGNVH